MGFQSLGVRIYTVGNIISFQQSCEIGHISHPFSWLPFPFPFSLVLCSIIYGISLTVFYTTIIYPKVLIPTTLKP